MQESWTFDYPFDTPLPKLGPGLSKPNSETWVFFFPTITKDKVL